MNLIAVDASTKSSGIAIYKHNILTDYTCITSTSTDLFNRIKVMTNGISELLIKNPDLEYLILE